MSWSPVLQMAGGMSGAWTFGFLGPLVGLIVMGTLVYLLVRAVGGGQSERGASHPGDAMETLRERYARGEIDEEAFEKRARTLREQ